MARHLSMRIGLLVCALAFAPAAVAQVWPTRTIKLLVGFSAGGATDIVARIYAEKLRETLGVPVIVENKPGASQLVAMRELIGAQPDGYTICIATVSALTQAPVFRPVAGYDPLTDFPAVAMIATAPGIFVVDPKLPITSMKELIAQAKAKPQDLMFSTAGVGSANHVQLEYFMHATGTQMRSVPYKSDQEATFEVATSRVNVSLTVANFALPLVLEGKLRPIAVSGARRLKEIPDVPTLGELGIAGLNDVTYLSYYGLIAPRGLDVKILQVLNQAINKASNAPDVQSRMKETLSMEMHTGTPDDFRAFLASDIAKWRELQRETGIKF